MSLTVIDLNKFRSNGARVFSGRPRGQTVRESLGLDSFDIAPTGQVLVKIPDDVYSVNTSFFLGLFGKSVRAAHSKENFLKRFKFECPKELVPDIEYGIDRALKDETQLIEQRS